jgi:hypothetical protein
MEAMSRLLFALAFAFLLLFGNAMCLSAEAPKAMVGVWRGHSKGKQELAFGISRTESDDQFTISDDLRTVTLLPLGGTHEVGRKMEQTPVHSVTTTLTTEARLEKGDLIVKRTVRRSTGEDRQTWTFHLQSPSTLHVSYASSFVDTAGGQLSWCKTEGTLQKQ